MRLDGDPYVDGGPDLAAPVPVSPESLTTFRLARLLLFLEVATTRDRPVPSIDRLGYYEFFADNPFIILASDAETDVTDRLALERAGFSPVQLSYASTGQRFVSRRQRLQHDLGLLVAHDLVALGDAGFIATTTGTEVAQGLNSVYADAYRVSASIVLRRLWAMSGRALDLAARQWLGDSWLLIDLLDDISGTAAPVSVSSKIERGNP